MAQPPDAGAEPGSDPSMEDILASIRRILSEEEQGGEAKPAPPDAVSPGEPSPAHDILLLNEDMMVPDPAPEPVREFAPHPVADAAPPATPASMPASMPPPMPLALQPAPVQPNQVLVAPEAAQAAASSLGALVRTLSQERGTAVRTGGPTIEDLVREEVRPILKEWLDAHLPPLVERLVRAEIARVVGQVNL